MKKILSLLLALTLVFVLVACSDEKETTSESDTSTTQTEITDTNDTQTSATDTDENLSDTETPSNSTPTSSKPTDPTSAPTTNTSRPTTNSNSTTTHTHIYSAATCNEPKKCKICSAISGKALGHNYENGTCKICNAKDPNYVQYAITYNSNGGWGETVSSSHTYNEARALSKNGFKRAGYAFVGWNTDANATTAKYTDAQNVKNLTKTNGANIVLYAVWKATQTYAFEDLMPLEDSIDNIKFHQIAQDNMGKIHNDVLVLVDEGGYYAKPSSSERFTNGLFSKLKGTIIPVSSKYQNEGSEAMIRVYADGEKIYESTPMNKYAPAQSFEIDISGVNVLRISIYDRSKWEYGGELMLENLTLIR